MTEQATKESDICYTHRDPVMFVKYTGLLYLSGQCINDHVTLYYWLRYRSRTSVMMMVGTEVIQDRGKKEGEERGVMRSR